MKSNRLLASIFIAMLSILAACGTGTEEKEVTVSSIFEESVEAIKTVESYSTKVDMTMDMFGMTTQILIEGDVTQKPDTVHMNMKMGIPGMTMDTEIYGVDSQFYMSMFGEWFEMDPEEMGMEDFEQMTAAEMEIFAQYADEIELTTNENVYVLSLSASGEEYLDLVRSYVKSSLGDYSLADEDLEEMLENIILNKVDYEMHINKETMLQTYGKFTIDMEIIEDGFSMSILVDGEMEIYNVNNVEPVVIPQEVIENAISMEEADLFFGDFGDFEDFDFEFDEEFDFEDFNFDLEEDEEATNE